MVNLQEAVTTRRIEIPIGTIIRHTIDENGETVCHLDFTMSRLIELEKYSGTTFCEASLKEWYVGQILTGWATICMGGPGMPNPAVFVDSAFELADLAIAKGKSCHAG